MFPFLNIEVLDVRVRKELLESSHYSFTNIVESQRVDNEYEINV